MLRDGLVCGINDEVLQRKLLAEKNLTYESAHAWLVWHSYAPSAEKSEGSGDYTAPVLAPEYGASQLAHTCSQQAMADKGRGVVRQRCSRRGNKGLE